MEVSREELCNLFTEGMVRGVLWNDETMKHATECLPNMNVTELALVDNYFADESFFRALLQLLATHQELARLYISQEDLSTLLKDISVEFANHPNTLQELELVATRGKIRDADAIHLKQLVQIPSKCLSITFSLKQKDYGPCLLALRQGMDELRAQCPQDATRLPRVCFRNVSFPDHEFYLHRFVAMVCEAKCVDCLQINPRRRRVASASESMRAGPGFVQALARLLAFGSVASLEVTNVVLDVIPMDMRIASADVYQALIRNTTLKRLSMPLTKGLAILWQQAIFPALTVNRTLRRVEFGNEMGTVASFLQHLPLMQGLQSIQAPWRVHDGPQWVAAVQQTESLVQANFVLVPDLQQQQQQQHSQSLADGEERQRQRQRQQQDACLTATRQLVERNRLTQVARQMVRAEPAPGPLMDQLAGLTQVDAGLDARFVVLRESLALFAM